MGKDTSVNGNVDKKKKKNREMFAIDKTTR